MAIDPGRLVAHRGFAGRYPENTRESLAAAVRLGMRYLELDVQLSADGVPVVLHDVSLERTAGCAGSVFDLSAIELTAVEVNESRRLGGAFTGVTIPLLSEVASALAGWPGVNIFVEIKPHSLARFGTGFTVARVLDALAPVLDSCVVISFSNDAVAEVRRLSCCRIGWVIKHWTEASHQTALSLAPDYLFCDYLKIPPGTQALWPGPWCWVAYEVGTADLAGELDARGVGLFETMNPDLLLAGLNPGTDPS